MKLVEFCDDIRDNCSHISYLCVSRVFDKLYSDYESHECTQEEINDIIANYPLLLRYLNDYAGVIYRRYNSSVEKVYTELCLHLKLDKDNKFTCEHIIKKLEKQNPQLILGLEDDDIKLQTIENFDEKLEQIKQSKYYNNNLEELEDKVASLEKNISLVKRASGM